MKKQQLQQLTAHDKVLIFENFNYLLEALEEYIEKTGYYSDFKDKRQLRNITVKDNLSLRQAESLFRTRLLIFAGMDTPDFLSGEVKEEFYRWIDKVGIDMNNCPERLKHFLLETNNVIEGNDEKIIKQTQENLESKKNDPNFQSMDNVIKVFGSIQKPLEEKREQGKLFEGKFHGEVKVESRFGSGNIERGQEAFSQLTRTVSSSSGDFNFFSLNNRTNSEIIQDIRQNPRNWRVDEIIVDLRENKQETVLIHQSARLNDYDQRTGKLNLVSNPIYQASRFNAEEITQINQVLNIPQPQPQQQQPPYKWNF